MPAETVRDVYKDKKGNIKIALRGLFLLKLFFSLLYFYNRLSKCLAFLNRKFSFDFLKRRAYQTDKTSSVIINVRIKPQGAKSPYLGRNRRGFI